MRRKDVPDTNAKTVDSTSSDIYTGLQEKRVLFLVDEINSESANRIAAQLVMLDLESNDDIYLFINSEGGNVTDTMAIYDVMHAIASDVSTICIGEAASGAAVLLCGGVTGKRYMLPNARIMMHQPQGGIEGSTRDVEIEAKELIRLRELLSDIIGKHTGLSQDRLQTLLDRDTYLTPEQAKQMGIIDEIVNRIPLV